jgi:hypothetical protein
MAKRKKADIVRPKLKLPESIQRQLVADAEALAKSIARRKKTDIVALKLRLREHLRKRLETAARAQERSLNSELVARLEESFVRDRGREEREEVLKTLQEMVQVFSATADRATHALRGLEANNARWEAHVRAADPKVAEQIREIQQKILKEEREARDRQAAGESPELITETNEEPELFTETPRRQEGKK